MRALQYRILRKVHVASDDALEDLQKDVNFLIECGWQPQGGLIINNSDKTKIECAQAMIKVEDK